MSINFCLFAKSFTMDTIKILFWSCLFIIFYTYIGYGILLYILVKVKRIFMGKPELPPMNNNEHLPDITLLICAYNYFFFLMIRRPPRSTLFPYTDALPLHNTVVSNNLQLFSSILPLNQHNELELQDRKSTRLNSSHQIISYAVFCLKK